MYGSYIPAGKDLCGLSVITGLDWWTGSLDWTDLLFLRLCIWKTMKTSDICCVISKLQAPCQNIIETMGIPGVKAIIRFS